MRIDSLIRWTFEGIQHIDSDVVEIVVVFRMVANPQTAGVRVPVVTAVVRIPWSELFVFQIMHECTVCYAAYYDPCVGPVFGTPWNGSVTEG